MLDRIEFNKSAKKIQSRLSRQGVSVVLDAIRIELGNQLDYHGGELTETIEQLVEDYFADAATKPVINQQQPGSNLVLETSKPNSTNALAIKQQSQDMVAAAAQKLDISLSKQELADIAADFSNGYTTQLNDVELVLGMLRKWVNHQESVAAATIERLETELTEAISGSHSRTASRVKGLLATTRKNQADFLSDHQRSMEEINDFFATLMQDVPA
jgi:hypothetical protein